MVVKANDGRFQLLFRLEDVVIGQDEIGAHEETGAVGAAARQLDAADGLGAVDGPGQRIDIDKVIFGVDDALQSFLIAHDRLESGFGGWSGRFGRRQQRRVNLAHRLHVKAVGGAQFVQIGRVGDQLVLNQNPGQKAGVILGRIRLGQRVVDQRPQGVEVRLVGQHPVGLQLADEHAGQHAGRGGQVGAGHEAAQPGAVEQAEARRRPHAHVVQVLDDPGQLLPVGYAQKLLGHEIPS